MDASTRNPEVAVVLAGGKSRRLGTDKAAVLLDGKAMLLRTAELAGRFCPVVAVSGRDPSALTPGLPWFVDETPGLGPIGGIITALERYRTPCLVLSCDLPHLDEPTIERLLAAWREKPAYALMTTFLQVETGFIEALVSVYEPEAAGLLRSACQEGCRKLSRAVPPWFRHHVHYSLREAQVFFNVNTPADLESAQAAVNLPGRNEKAPAP